MSGSQLILTLILVHLAGDIFADKVFFPASNKVQLDPPQPCPNGKRYCSGEYPLAKIKAIIDQAVELNRSPENTDHFFHQLEEDVNNNKIKEEGYEPACSSRREMIPQKARARNIDKKWRYLVEVADSASFGGTMKTQQVEVHICEGVDKKCKNDQDSPNGEETTVCKQLFRTQKLLAVNEDGEIVVDTFELPSACICNSKDPFRTRFEAQIRGPNTFSTVCRPNMTVSAPLKTWTLRFGKRQADNSGIIFGPRPKPVTRAKVPPNPRLQPQESCIRSSPGLRSNLVMECAGYPENDVLQLLRQSATFRSPTHFKKLFEQPCNSTTIANNASSFAAIRSHFEPDEHPLCDSVTQWIYPKVAKTVQGQWRYIVNIEQYKQGVSVVKCNLRRKDEACKYGGKEGNIPSATSCKQVYTRHNMLTVSPDNGVGYDTFLIPSACICHYKKAYFDY